MTAPRKKLGPPCGAQSALMDATGQAPWRATCARRDQPHGIHAMRSPTNPAQLIAWIDGSQEPAGVPAALFEDVPGIKAGTEPPPPGRFMNIDALTCPPDPRDAPRCTATMRVAYKPPRHDYSQRPDDLPDLNAPLPIRIGEKRCRLTRAQHAADPARKHETWSIDDDGTLYRWP